MTVKERFERELMQHGNMCIDWLTDNVCMFYDTNDRTDRGVAVIKGATIIFIDDKFEKNEMSIVEYEHMEDDPVEYLVLRDIDLCIDEDDSGCMSFSQLHDLCVKHCVDVELEAEVGPSNWPTYTFRGLERNIKAVLKELGFDDYDDLVAHAYDEHENVILFMQHLASMLPQSELDEKHCVLYCEGHLLLWFDDGLYNVVSDMETRLRSQILDYVIEYRKTRR